MFDRTLLIADLTAEEGDRFVIYDDAAPDAIIGPGYTLKGNPTIGIGHALNLTPFTREQTETILGWDIDAKAPALYAALSWLEASPEPIQRALLNMAFNMGVAGLLSFNTFLSLTEAKKYQAAADDLKSTKWASQVGSRAVKIEALIRSAA